MQILGIRHHGPGSARNVKDFLEEMKPDIVLVEGPPDANDILQWVGKSDLQPPVAILAYQPEDPQQSLFYPFAEFSPEWQAILYARKNNIPVRFMDLPVMHSMAIEKERIEKAKTQGQEQKKENEVAEPTAIESADATAAVEGDEKAVPHFPIDPISHLANAAGYSDGEKWWEVMFEQRLNNEAIFEAVGETMQELREAFPKENDAREKLREAYMRKVIREAEREMFTNIAVICGAWHVPALTNMPKQKEDNELLKGLPKVKIQCSWVPWTYDRLSFESGYGAGIQSPGWYEHLWHYPKDDGTRWMSKVAALFRGKQMDISVAHVIEAVRLADSLAALRQLPRPGLYELNEATWSVLCNGENILLNLVRDELIVSNKIGAVPEDVPKPPLQVDIEKIQKRLRLPQTADWKDYTLDLRKENDLERSIFLHRLLILQINWGEKTHSSSKGTFKEAWRVQWRPELSVDIVDKGTWGNTVEEAVSSFLIDRCKSSSSLQEVAGLLQLVIPAELTGAASFVATHIANMAAATNDVLELIKVIPKLADIVRYGNVRQTDTDMILSLLTSMVTRVCIGLPAACCGVDENTATAITDDSLKIEHSIQLLKHQPFQQQWQQCLQQIAFNVQAAPMLRGFAVRHLMDAGAMKEEVLYNTFYSSMSKAVPPPEASAWLEGFLKGSGTLLLLDENLWQMVNNWVTQLNEEVFTQLLPLLRRTFAVFSKPERRKIGEKVKFEGSGITKTGTQISINKERAETAIGVVMELMGYSSN
ncbi:DUF5682 family protein [Pinibacter soli]|uniref:DUF5682 family protein n=1 Tax=Pinibacter soli TaxID=3044211 RepID=A0ABT6REN6_9BACT|nr:DUF5682 family protein [Pinibacter soli]MDI3321034.1 DUF5682 family protein [Pinibacter soli]